MSLHVRTSVKAGPLRLNLSPAGINISAGIPGLRVGTGPRGSYVKMAAGGVSYRSTARNDKVARPLPAPGPAASSEVPLSDVRGSASLELLPAQPSEVVAQLNAAAKATLLWPWSLTAVLILAVAATPWVLLPGVVLVAWLWWHDKVRRTVVLFYEVDGPGLAGYQALLDSFTAVREAEAAWRTVASGEVRTTYQRKVNAGAGHLVERQALTRGVTPGPHISANIEIPTLRSPGRTVYLLPDRILVKDGKTYADVDYRALQVDSRNERFIETGRVPGDAVLVDRTWRYVNKNGGPDRRFKDNAQLPIMNYGQVEIRSTAGLHLLWSFSRTDAAQRLAGALLAMRR